MTCILQLAYNGYYVRFFHEVCLILAVTNECCLTSYENRPFCLWCLGLCNNEGTKVQNPRRLCHVQSINYPHGNIHVATYADKCVNVRGSKRKFGKDKSSEKDV